MRAAWLPSNIRNASGNGGGVLIGYMPIVSMHLTSILLGLTYSAQVIDQADPSDRNTKETLEWAHFKREVYHKVGETIFNSLVHRSHIGDTLRCGDNVVRVLHPGVLIESLDHEEATILACVRAANANFPCIKCLVPKSELHTIDGHFAPRTVTAMQDVLKRASNAKTDADREKILKDVGLHAVPVSFFKFC